MALGATITASALVARSANQRAEAQVNAFVAQDRGSETANHFDHVHVSVN